ncbi:MBL fold metallo-hydrolase [Bradymonas sediminis]|uniref:MBL fold metallo-hydrolase n=1 Tax=Bradymonas sediminis TaxID=1548548 RepID=UPI003B845DCD
MRGGFAGIPQIDVAILPIGAYEPRWFVRFNHMNPAEALQVFDTLDARHFVPMHWGAFDLSNKPLNHGVEVLRNLISEQKRDATRRASTASPRAKRCECPEIPRSLAGSRLYTGGFLSDLEWIGIRPMFLQEDERFS